MRILGEIGMGHDQRMKRHPHHFTTGHACNQDVARLVDNLHGEPRKCDKAHDQQNLWKALHDLQAFTGAGGRTRTDTAF